jgi:hypothetical protein
MRGLPPDGLLLIVVTSMEGQEGHPSYPWRQTAFRDVAGLSRRWCPRAGSTDDLVAGPSASLR